MKKFKSRVIGMLSSIAMVVFTLSSCIKQPPGEKPYNLDVTLLGGKSYGHIDFRQDSDTAKIITLNTTIFGLEPNHEYQLQRAADTLLDGNCSSAAWLTLGKGLQPQSILTNGYGIGNEKLFRSVATIPSGKLFDIHFQVIDKADSAVVLTSDCYRYAVR